MIRFQKKKKQDPNNPDPNAHALAVVAHAETVQAARDCLNSELFAKYAEQYQKAEQAAIQAFFLLDQTEADPARFAFKAKELINNLRHAKLLMNSVKNEAGMDRFTKKDISHDVE